MKKYSVDCTVITRKPVVQKEGQKFVALDYVYDLSSATFTVKANSPFGAAQLLVRYCDDVDLYCGIVVDNSFVYCYDEEVGRVVADPNF